MTTSKKLIFVLSIILGIMVASGYSTAFAVTINGTGEQTEISGISSIVMAHQVADEMVQTASQITNRSYVSEIVKNMRNNTYKVTLHQIPAKTTN